MRSEIKKWGNSAAIRLPARVLAEARLSINESVRMTVKERKIVIEAAEDHPAMRLKLPFTEAELVSGMNPQSSHAELLSEPLDEELGD